MTKKEFDTLENKLIVSPKLYALLCGFKIVFDEYVPENEFYFVDDRGNVHYFIYRGVNLCGIQETK